MRAALTRLFDCLAEMFDTEESPTGREIACALRDHRRAGVLPTVGTRALEDETRPICFAPGALEAAHLADTLWSELPWFHAGLEDGCITAEVARRMLTCEILGPDGMVFCPEIRVGLFAQAPGVDYPVRRHAAEETFVMLAGEGSWRMPPGDWRVRGPGEHVHHPSMAPHQSRSNRGAFLAAWRWAGDVGWGSYRLDRTAEAA